MAEVISRALLADTAPNAFQVTPSVEYCQVPLPVWLVIAMPLSGPLSTSAQEADVRIALAVVPTEAVSSFVPASVTVAPLVMVGASLTGFTVIVTVATFESAVPSLAR